MQKAKINKTVGGGDLEVILQHRISALEAAVGALHGTGPVGRVVCRDEQIAKIERCVTSRLTKKCSGILFLSGAPGTGKTMSANFALENLKSLSMPKTLSAGNGPKRSSSVAQRRSSCPNLKDENILSLNAAGLTDAFDLFEQLAVHFGVPDREIREFRRVAQQHGAGAAFEKLLDYRQSNRRAEFSVVVIDEIDQLRSRTATPLNPPGGLPTSTSSRRRVCAQSSDSIRMSGNNILKLFFSFFKDPRSKSILIAIANSVALLHDITEDPTTFESMVFESYSVAQLQKIVESRLHLASGAQKETGDLESPPMPALVDPRALEFCIRKISSSHGDCRQVLDAARRLVSSKLYDLSEEYNTLKLREDSDKIRRRTRTTHIPSLVQEERLSPTEKRRRSHSVRKRKSKAVDFEDCVSPAVAKSPSSGAGAIKGSSATYSSDISTAANSECPSPSAEAIQRLCDAVGFADVQRVLEPTTNNEKGRRREIVARLPQHQQLLLCAVCLAQHDTTNGVNLPRLAAECDENSLVEVNNEEVKERSKNKLHAKHQRSTSTLEVLRVGQILNRYVSLCKVRQIAPQFNQTSIIDGLESLQNCQFIAFTHARDKQRNNMRRITVPSSFAWPKRSSTMSKAQITGDDGVVDLIDDHTNVLAALQDVNGFFSAVIQSERITL